MRDGIGGPLAVLGLLRLPHLAPLIPCVPPVLSRPAVPDLMHSETSKLSVQSAGIIGAVSPALEPVTRVTRHQEPIL